MSKKKKDQPLPGENGGGTDSPQGGADPNGNASPPGTSPDPAVMIGISVAEYDQLHAELSAARDESDKNRDGWQRALADYNNLRRRTEQEREQMRADAVGAVVKPFLDVVDDLDLAIRNRPAEGLDKGWAEGIELVYRKLLGRLEAQGVRTMGAPGEPFDPRLHEAITQEPSEWFMSGQVIDVVKPGYVIGERVLRPALVRVAA